MYKVKFEVSYKFNGYGRCEALLRVLLPADTNGEIIPELCNYNEELLGEKLTSVWGFLGEGYRYKETKLCGDTWQDIGINLNELVEEISKKIQRIYDLNKELKEAMRYLEFNELYLILE